MIELKLLKIIKKICHLSPLIECQLPEGRYLILPIFFTTVANTPGYLPKCLLPSPFLLLLSLSILFSLLPSFFSSFLPTFLPSFFPSLLSFFINRPQSMLGVAICLVKIHICPASFAVRGGQVMRGKQKKLGGPSGNVL